MNLAFRKLVSHYKVLTISVMKSTRSIQLLLYVFKKPFSCVSFSYLGIKFGQVIIRICKRFIQLNRFFKICFCQINFTLMQMNQSSVIVGICQLRILLYSLRKKVLGSVKLLLFKMVVSASEKLRRFFLIFAR